MFIDLTLARFSDLIEPKEKVILEKNIIEHIAYINSLIAVSFKEEVKREEARKIFESSLYKLLDIYRTNQIQQQLTIPQNYLAYLVHSHGQKLQEEIWINYVDDYVKAFEERSFRTQLNRVLEKLAR